MLLLWVREISALRCLLSSKKLQHPQQEWTISFVNISHSIGRGILTDLLCTEMALAWEAELQRNCGLWIWAIQIKFDWLIDWLICPIETKSLSASTPFENKRSKSKHKPGISECKCGALSESITKSELEINKSCSQTERTRKGVIFVWWCHRFPNPISFVAPVSFQLWFTLSWIQRVHCLNS